jgi:hypothetical protein
MLSNEDEAILDSIIRLAEYLYHVELTNSAARGAAVMPSSTNLLTNMLSVSIGAHKYAACTIGAHHQVIFVNQQCIFK